ncbi:MAG TPA: acyl-CoA synthetase [Paracoccaceae bacterium]|nr:acyl-CoA synthetase [Paracoccaceae bacterium]
MTERMRFGNLADKAAIEAMPLDQRMPSRTVFERLSRTAENCPDHPAISFQIRSGPRDRAVTLSWAQLRRRVIQAANLFRELGIGQNDVVAYLLPNCNEAVVTLLAGCTAGIVAPVNPLMEPGHIAAILREANAKVLVTLAPFPKSDVAARAHEAVAEAPCVQTVLEVDLRHYLAPPLSWVVPFIRPRTRRCDRVRTLDFNREVDGCDGARLTFAEEGDGDRVGACFHTGGTTGMPKLARHRQLGMVYNGLCASATIIGHEDVLLCPLPLFHVFSAYPILMTCVTSGAHMVMPTPAGYRGEGVFDNFWKLVERWGVTFMVMVPTAASALMQRKVDADVSTLKYALCGSAPLPAELFRRFEAATDVKILEGYGMTEATCLIAVNPPHGERKIGSVGLPFPYTQVKILHTDDRGDIVKACGTDEIDEICVLSAGVFPGYGDETLNARSFAGPERWLRTGDLGRIDADGYLWITWRAKDLIIRGGHNIDPALVEEALAAHPDVAFVGAVGQPDAHSGEVAAAYVELRAGATATGGELRAFCEEKIPERAAIPKHVEVLSELPKTAVGKVFKPDLRKRAIARVYGRALAEAGIDAEVEVVDDKARGLVARIRPQDGADAARIGQVLDAFPRPWELAGG